MFSCWGQLPAGSEGGVSATPEDPTQARHPGLAPSGSASFRASTSRNTAEPFCPGVWLERALVLNNTFPQMRTSIRWQRQPAAPPGSGQDGASIPAQGTGCLPEPCRFPSPRGPLVRRQLSQPDRLRSSAQQPEYSTRLNNAGLPHQHTTWGCREVWRERQWDWDFLPARDCAELRRFLLG